MPAGYSGKPLAQKLGIKQGQRLLFLNPPSAYRIQLGELPEGVTVSQKLKGKYDFVQLFEKDKAALERQFPLLKKSVEQDGMVWVSWPKGSSKLPTDLNDGVVREIGLKNGMVDVKVCSVDDTWTALKFVTRVRDRL
jgi:hypothetical protein